MEVHLPGHRYTEPTIYAGLTYLAVHLIDGKPDYAGASRALGIPDSTLCNWWQAEQEGQTHHLNAHDWDAIQERRRKLREEKKEEVLALTSQAIDHCLKALLEAQSARDKRDLAVAYGILSEKYALFSGDATARTDSRVVHGRVRLPEKRPLEEFQLPEKLPRAELEALHAVEQATPALPAVPTREADPATPALQAQTGLCSERGVRKN